MCGIGGLIIGRHALDLQRAGRVVVDMLRHRGPDASGVHLLPDDFGVFAHTRLKIIDLSERAAQPFVSPDGKVVLTFNGEIYNFLELRSQLEARGVRFVSSSDTEVILHQYLQYGRAGLAVLDGMFALGIWDARMRQLLLMRDRFGKKPLYWTMTEDGAFLFASEVKAFSAHPAWHARMAVSHVPEFLTYGYVATPHSLFEGVRKVPPATVMVFEPGKEREPTSESYWRLPEVRALEIPMDEAKREIRRLVGAAVKKRLLADVPLGAFLSGGIDSSVIVAEMIAQGLPEVKSFTVGFDEDRSYDETLEARSFANRVGTKHTEIKVKPPSTEDLETLLFHHDEPYGDSSALALYAIAKATRPHVTVVLTGDGGDEVFAGYTRFLGGLLQAHLPKMGMQLAHRLLSRIPTPRQYKSRWALLQRLVEHADRSRDQQFLAWNSYFCGERLRALLRSDVFDASFDPWRLMEAQEKILAAYEDRLQAILQHNLRTYLLDDLLVKLDRMTMAVALEARSPFLDTQLVEFVFALPSEYKLRRGQLKYLLREAYRGVIPDETLDRKKHGFGVPVTRWWTKNARPLVHDMLLAPGARVHDFLRSDQLSKLVAEHQTGYRDHGQRIFALLQLELWLRNLSKVPHQAGSKFHQGVPTIGSASCSVPTLA